MDPHRQPNFRFIIRDAQPHERRAIEARGGRELGSDVCIAVWLDAKIIGWADDYGTFYLLPRPSSDGKIEEAGERFLDAAIELWVALDP